MSFFALSNFHFSKISISDHNPYYKTDTDGFVYKIMDGNAYSLFACPNKSLVQKLVIRDTVVVVNDFAISECDNLQEVVFPPKLKKLGYWSVKGCKQLSKITLYPEIEYISQAAFVDTNILDVYFMGTESVWKSHPKVNKDDTLETIFSSATIHFLK